MGWREAASGAAGGGAIGTVTGTPGLAAVGAVGGYSDGDYWENRNPLSAGSRDARKAAKNTDKDLNAWYGETQKINDKLGVADNQYEDRWGKSADEYLNKATGLTNEVTSKLNGLNKQSQTQANDAKATYTNDILPNYKNAMGMAKTNAEQAMTLAEAGDPNNPVMKAVRDLYNQQGQAARRQGQQDFGVLSALGAQAAQGQMGAAGPMTAGAMGQIYAQNQGQAGDAYARAQQRMYDLQQQGIDKGFDQSNLMYQFGQDAQGRYSDTIKDLQGGENSYYDQQGKFRDEQSGYAGDIYNVNQGLNQDRFGMNTTLAGIKKGNAYAGGGRDQSALDTRLGVKNQATSNELAAKSAQNTANMGFFGSVLGGAAQGAGSAAVASDKRMKHNISDISDKELDEFLSAVKPKTFNYDDPSDGGGKRIGFMLQDVQGTDLGDELTKKDGQGHLRYDRDNLNGIILAALARQNKKAA